MKLFNGLTAGVSLAAFMAVSSPARADALLESESLDHGYGQAQPTAEPKKDDKKKKKDDKKKDEEKKDEKAEGDDKGDKEHACGEGSCG